jgi:hypothetical protein
MANSASVVGSRAKRITNPLQAASLPHIDWPRARRLVVFNRVAVMLSVRITFVIKR